MPITSRQDFLDKMVDSASSFSILARELLLKHRGTWHLKANYVVAPTLCPSTNTNLHGQCDSHWGQKTDVAQAILVMDQVLWSILSGGTNLAIDT